MKQQVHYWNLHNHCCLDEFIDKLIREGHSIKTTMATAYHGHQATRAIIVTEQNSGRSTSPEPLLLIEFNNGSQDILVKKVTFQDNKMYYRIADTTTGGWNFINTIKSITIK